MGSVGIADIPNWADQGEAKRFVIEQTLTQALNPFSSWQNGRQPDRQKPAVMTYSVQTGDTLSAIAEKYGITLNELVAQNKIDNPNLVGIGMKLVVRKNDTTHMVRQGETLVQIAHRYATTEDVIIARNPLVKILANQLYVGQTLYIPLPDSQSMQTGSFQTRSDMARAASRIQFRMRRMDWPVAEPTITSGFGMRWGKMHKGVDLWNEKEKDAPITAAREGIVVEAGVHNDYGDLVVVDHGNGLQSYYAHMGKISVYSGQAVEAGDILGYMGQTGDATGYHLHFEVRQDNIPVNPLPYLPR